jgi:hypothetical protein
MNRYVWAGSLAMLLATIAWAGPGLPVTKPPLGPVPSWTGPVVDPDAVQGQWFYDLASQSQTPRPYEFHDNVLDFGGGFKSFLAIEGYATNIQLQGGKILSFDVQATVTNDMPSSTPWLEGGNSHGEYVATTREQYIGPMLNTVLAAEFALGDLQLIPNGFSAPYRQGFLPYIIATNEDKRGWYCYTPGSPPQGQSTAVGNYYVPSWDFGTINPGLSATRILSFAVDGVGMDPADPRFQVIMESYSGHIDLLSNRTTSLKISNWIDNLTADLGVPYPTDPYNGSDASVFFTPEPTSLGLLALGAMAFIRRRR